MSDFDRLAERHEILRCGLKPAWLPSGAGRPGGDHTLQIVGQNVEAHRP